MTGNFSPTSSNPRSFGDWLEQSPIGASRFLVISRPGAGKSATFKWLASSASPISAILIRGADHRILPADASLNVDDYRTLAFGELATAIILESRSRFNLSDSARKRANSFTRKRAVQGVAKFFAERFEGLNILGSGFKLSEPERRKYLDRMRDREFQAELESVLIEIAGQIRLVVAIDDPEYMSTEGTDTLSRENATRLGATLSALSRLDALGLHIVAFLREQIYRSVVEYYGDSSHFADRTNGLGWTSLNCSNSLNRASKNVLVRLGLKSSR